MGEVQIRCGSRQLRAEPVVRGIPGTPLAELTAEVPMETAKTMGYVMLGLIGVGILFNLKDIRRYIQINRM